MHIFLDTGSKLLYGVNQQGKKRGPVVKIQQIVTFIQQGEILMKTLFNKIEKAFAASETKGEDRPSGDVYLTAAELQALVKSRKVATFSYITSLNRYLEDGGSEYFMGVGSGINITRKQAKKIADDFKEWSVKDDKNLLAKVYISDWSYFGEDKIYVSFM